MTQFSAGHMGYCEMCADALFVVDDWDYFKELRKQFPHNRILHVNAILDAALLSVVYKLSAVVVTPSIDTRSEWFLGEVVSRMAPGATVYVMIPAGGIPLARPEEPET